MPKPYNCRTRSGLGRDSFGLYETLNQKSLLLDIADDGINFLYNFVRFLAFVSANAAFADIIITRNRRSDHCVEISFQIILEDSVTCEERVLISNFTVMLIVLK